MSLTPSAACGRRAGRWLAVAMLAAVVLVAGVSGQQVLTRDNATPAAVPTGTSAISGIVLTAEPTPQPIGRATVTLTGDGTNRTATSDESGRFVFEELPAGRFTVVAVRPGHARMEHGALRPDRAGTPIVVAIGQRIEDIRIALPKGAAITGVVRDEQGRPARGINVRLFEFGRRGVDRVLVTPAVTAAGGVVSAQTDDLGSYRLYNLPAADYIVAAVPQGNAVTTGPRATAAPNPSMYAPVFYPGTPLPSAAAPISLTAGEERANADIQLMVVPTASISGRVFSPAGLPGRALAQLIPHAPAPLWQGGIIPSATVGEDGQFTFNGVGPGDYTVGATAFGAPLTAGTPGSLWGQTGVSVNGPDVREVVVVLQLGPSLSGRVMFDGGPMPTDIAPRPRFAIVREDLVPGSMLFGNFTANGEFRVERLVPGRYHFIGSLPWTLATATVKGADAIDLPFEIAAGEDVTGATVTFTRLTQEVSGVLQTAAGLPATEFTLIVFPTDQVYWRPGTRRTQTVRPGTDGRFVLRGLPPGEYFMAALTDLSSDDASDPSFLGRIVPDAVRFSLGPGENKKQDLRVGSQ